MSSWSCQMHSDQKVFVCISYTIVYSVCAICYRKCILGTILIKQKCFKSLIFFNHVPPTVNWGARLLEAQLYSCVGLSGIQLLTQNSFSAAWSYQDFYLRIYQPLVAAAARSGLELIFWDTAHLPFQTDLCVFIHLYMLCKHNYKCRCNSVYGARF